MGVCKVDVDSDLADNLREAIGAASDTHAGTHATGNVKTAMLDKIAYWSGTIPATERTPQQEQQAQFSMFALAGQDHYAMKVAGLAIAETCIKDAVEVTDTNTVLAVDNVLSGNLAFLI